MAKTSGNGTRGNGANNQVSEAKVTQSLNALLRYTGMERDDFSKEEQAKLTNRVAAMLAKSKDGDGVNPNAVDPILNQRAAEKRHDNKFKHIDTIGINQAYNDATGKNLISTASLSEKVARGVNNIRTATGADRDAAEASLRATLAKGRTESIASVYNGMLTFYRGIPQYQRSERQRTAMDILDRVVRDEMKRRKR